jgi:LacI family transcriptional regulator
LKKKVTIYDIAKEVNYSVSTVSRVLGNSKRTVNPEIKRVIEEAAKRMHYYPNTLARNLKTNTNDTIGIVLPSIANPFYPSIVRGMEDEAMLNGYSINICSCDSEKKRIDRYFEKLIENGVSGIITIYLDEMPLSLENYISRGGKVLTIGTKEQSFHGCAGIHFDKEEEAYLATKHLLELGHRHIALFLLSFSNTIRIEKYKGYKKALHEYGIEETKQYVYLLEEDDIQQGDLDSSSECNAGIHCAKKLIAESNAVTAIVCMNDLVALGCISELKASGYRVPEDYSVIGFDDSFFSKLVDPQITTIKIDKYDLGKEAIKVMLDIFEDASRTYEKDFSDSTKLIVRKSTSYPRS